MMKKTCQEEFQKLKIPYELNYSHENSHEYLGALKVWECRHSFDIILYFHSKGISRYRGGKRENIESKIFDMVIREWKYVLWIFENMLSIDKIGPCCSKQGWIWHTVYWTRGSYLQKVEKPVRTKDRYYYEFWIAKQVYDIQHLYPTKKYSLSDKRYNYRYTNCWNLKTINQFKNIGSFYSQKEVIRNL
jgi:hypothetical protein